MRTENRLDAQFGSRGGRTHSRLRIVVYATVRSDTGALRALRSRPWSRRRATVIDLSYRWHGFCSMQGSLMSNTD